MGLLSNEVDRSMLEPGDHIYSYRIVHSYTHHGIYVREDRVIHYTRTKPLPFEINMNNSPCSSCKYDSSKQRGVVKTCLDCFLKGHRLFRCEYQVPKLQALVIRRVGTCSTDSCFTPDVVVQRANGILEKFGFGNYDLFDNNCECFAVFCKTGNHTSPQARPFKHIIRTILN